MLVVALETLELRRQATSLYRSVFGYTGSDNALSQRMLRGLLANGGSALGAVDDDGTLTGFSYGFTGIEAGAAYHYSQATVVATGRQGTGVGAALKRAQADVARATGVTSMRWAFDPASARNAHFNFDTLGARGRWFRPDFYDEPDSDRMIVEWPLLPGSTASSATLAARDAAFAAISNGAQGGRFTPTGDAGDYSWARLPATLDTEAGGRRAVRADIATACQAALADGYAAVSCRRIGGTEDAVYLFERGSA